MYGDVADRRHVRLETNSAKGGRIMSYISRNLETVVENVTREYPVVLVTGPRQVGKTTMLQ